MMKTRNAKSPQGRLCKAASRRAQIKMFETISVIIVFFFLLVIGMVYYNSTQKNEIKKMNEEDKQLRAIEIMKIVTYLPELRCSKDNVFKPNCMDLVKLQNFRQVSDQEMLYYTAVFSFANISVKEIYPGETEYNIYFNNKTTKITGKDSSSIPILIHDPINRVSHAGILVVEIYQ